MKKIELTLTLDEVNTILVALGNMPYSQVNEIVTKIQQEARTQLDTVK